MTSAWACWMFLHAIISFAIGDMCMYFFLFSGLPFKPPCPVQRMEITFPHVIDIQDKHVRSEIPGNTAYRSGAPLSSDLPEAFFLEVSWRRQKVQLALYRSQISPPNSFSEWDDGNETFIEVIDDKCFYHGYVKGQRSSYTAVSTCSGVVS